MASTAVGLRALTREAKKMKRFRAPKAGRTVENAEKSKEMTTATAAAVTSQLWRRKKWRMEIVALWMTMNAIVSTLRLGLEKGKTLAAGMITHPRSIRAGGAEGVMAGAAMPAIAVAASPRSMDEEESEEVVSPVMTEVMLAPLVIAESIASKRA